MRNAFRIFLWGAVALVLIAILVQGLNGSTIGLSLPRLDITNAYSFSDPEAYSIGPATLSGDGIDRIEVDWVSGSVNIYRTDEAQIRIEESASKSLSEREHLRYRVKDGRLTIRYSDSSGGGLFFTMAKNKTLDLYVPKSIALQTLSVDSVSGDVNIDGAGTTVGNLDVESTSGTVALWDIATRQLDVEMISGELDIAGAFDKIDLESVSGGMRLRFNRMPVSFHSETVSGDVHLTLPENSGFTASLDSVSGRIRCDFATMNGQKRAQYGDLSASLKMQSVSGNVTIEKDSTLQSIPTAPTVPAVPTAPTMPQATDISHDSVPSSGRSF